MDLRTIRVCVMAARICNRHCVYCFEKYKLDGRFETAVVVLEPELAAFGVNRRPGERFAVEFIGG